MDQDKLEQLLRELVLRVMEDRHSQQPTDSASEPTPASKGNSAKELTHDYIEFTHQNPTIYHVVKHYSDELKQAGFLYLLEKESWENLKPGKYWTTRSGTCLAAFVVGLEWTPAKGVGILGAHIDALTVLLKPNSCKKNVEGYELLGVAPYAGALSDPWWDRDLGIGGRILVKQNLSVKDILVNSTPHPIARIPTLAPHFGAPSKGPFNKETKAVPIIGFSGSDDKEEPATDEEKRSPLFGSHPLKLLRYIAKLANVSVGDIIQWDLNLFDVQKGTVGGLCDEFVFVPRVDDRVCSFPAIRALIETSKNYKPDSFQIVALYDNEEIGSLTRQGARGGLTELVVGRVISGRNIENTEEAIRVAYANSVVLSVDVSHLVNPNFSDEYLENHRPVPNKGLAIALDANGHMATDSVGLALVQQIAKKNGLELQYFQIRNDAPSGGTIGPHISSLTGALTIDMGIPQLSMHSIREAFGSKDIGLAYEYFVKFFADWRETYDLFQGI